MKNIHPDNLPDKIPDENESTGLMEPLLVTSPRHLAKINDMIMELTRVSALLYGSLPESYIMPLADLVRSMNCYYSNLIEGHNTHPVDIEKALRQEYSQDVKKRNLQHEALAHINVQQWIDMGGLKGRSLSVEGILGVHRRFCDLLPEELLWVEKPGTQERLQIIPGEYRHDFVQVGQHIPVSPGAVTRFMQRLEEGYKNISQLEKIMASATAHHRLNWIHPFLDGNGRVARLMSHAILFEVLDTGALWSVARGLARKSEEYKNHLANCDMKRRNDLDGRGHLSEEALAEFVSFFLDVCIDQVRFMHGLMQPEKLRHRILSWVKESMAKKILIGKSDILLGVVLTQGSVARADIPAMLGISERSARRITLELEKNGILKTEGGREPFHLAFPPGLAHIWMPDLFPEKSS